MSEHAGRSPAESGSAEVRGSSRRSVASATGFVFLVLDVDLIGLSSALYRVPSTAPPEHAVPADD